MVDAEFCRLRDAERELRRARQPGWAEWAAWRWSRGDLTQREIGAELGGVLATEVSDAIKDYLFCFTDARFWLNAGWGGYERGWWSIGIHGPARRALLCEHFGEAVPGFPGIVERQRRPDTALRNRWICEQRRRGRTLAAIGAEVGLCKQRVRQICGAV
jgi:hypothetical protein